MKTRKYDYTKFKELANEKFNGFYDYSKFEFNGAKIKSEIICPKHGSFLMTPLNHLNGHGCIECGKEKTVKSSKIDFNEFINRSNKVHNGFYDYSKVNYKNVTTKVEIICPKHGSFFQAPSVHYNGSGCKKCGYEKNAINQTITKTEFIKKCKKIHNNFYDYSNVDYKNSSTKVEIICPKHGSFFQKPKYHLSGQGCTKCGKEKTIKSSKIDFNEFINRSNKVHNSFYDYSKVNYKNVTTKVEIICPIHGSFFQTPNKHYNYEQGCTKCQREKRAIKQTYTNDTFITMCEKAHNNFYDYSKSVYSGSHNEFSIICPKHGKFVVSAAYRHLQGAKCPECISVNSSVNEEEIYDFIKDEYKGKIIRNDRSILKGKELDIYLPDKHLAIEYNGVYWHSELYKDKNYHQLKTLDCLSKNINLFHIWEDDWNNKKDIIKSMILNKLHLTKYRIGARKCTIKTVKSNIANEFLEYNHLHGKVNSSIRIGLFYNDELVSLMTLGKKRNFMKQKSDFGEYELYRFCNKLNHNIIGGFSKLYKHFLKNYIVNKIETYANLDHSNGNVYIKNGFVKVKTTKPGYYWIINDIKKHRYNYTKQKLIESGYDSKKTETQIMHELGHYKLFDAGNIKFEYLK